MTKRVATIPADVLELYERLVATNPSVERKGATMPYTSVIGHMFSFLTNAGKLALRLPAEDRNAFLKKYKTKLCEQHGTVLEERRRKLALARHRRREKNLELRQPTLPLEAGPSVANSPPPMSHFR